MKLNLKKDSMVKLNKYDLMTVVRRLPKSIKDLMIQPKYHNKVFIAGGCILSIITNEKIKDYDILVSDKETAKELRDDFLKYQNTTVYETKNAYTIKGLGIPIQIIYRWNFNLPNEVIESFDFTVSCSCVYFDGQYYQGICHKQYYEDISSKRLTYTHPIREEDPAGSFLRLLKFYKRGYQIPLDSLASVMTRLYCGINDGYLKNELKIENEINELFHQILPKENLDYISNFSIPDLNYEGY